MTTSSSTPYLLPTNNISIKVLAEGAANVIYQIIVDPKSRDIAEVDKDYQDYEYLSGNSSSCLIPFLELD